MVIVLQTRRGFAHELCEKLQFMYATSRATTSHNHPVNELIGEV